MFFVGKDFPPVDLLANPAFASMAWIDGSYKYEICVRRLLYSSVSVALTVLCRHQFD